MSRTLTACDEPQVVRVRNHLGYDAGFTLRCSCGWESNELRASEGQAVTDHWNHLIAQLSPTKEMNA